MNATKTPVQNLATEAVLAAFRGGGNMLDVAAKGAGLPMSVVRMAIKQSSEVRRVLNESISAAFQDVRDSSR